MIVIITLTLLSISTVKTEENAANQPVGSEDAALGRFCEVDDDCPTKYAICSTDKKCVCTPNTLALDNRICTIMLGSKCSEDDTCVSKYANCINNVCQCKENYSFALNQCFAQSLGTPCQDDQVCHSIKFGMCFENQCQCMSDTMKVSPTSCASILGGICWSNIDCLINNSRCLNNICQCKFKFEARNQTECVPDNLNVRCKSNDQCSSRTKYSECRNSSCVCKPNYKTTHDNKCRPLFGVECSLDSPCVTPNSVCINEKCQCLRYYVFQNERCVQSRLNGYCKNNEDCRGIPNAKCLKNRCICEDNYQRLNGFACGANLEGNCETDEECMVPNSVCIDNKCQCRPNYLALGIKKCIEAFEKKSCSHNNGCIDLMYTWCSEENRCDCRPKFGKLNDTACAPLVDEYCWSDNLCATENSICIDNRCQCNIGYSQLDSKCIRDYLGASCHIDNDCKSIRHAKCSEEKKCQCKDNYIQLSYITCAPLLGEFCWKSESCKTANSLCIYHECQCKDNYKRKSNNKCLASLLGQSCQQNNDCERIKYSECIDNKCQCKLNSVAAKNNEVCKSLLNGLCDTDFDCFLFNANCIDNKCQCLPSFRPQSNKKCLLIYTNVSCDDDRQCKVAKHATCSRYGKCICKDGHAVVGDQKCVPLLGQRCRKNCATLNTTCIDNECRCNPGYMSQHGNHCQPTRLGLHCQYNTDCDAVKHAQCSENACACKQNYLEVNKTLCVPLLGEFCTTNEPCGVENAVCLDNQCQCGRDFTPVANAYCVFESDHKFCRNDNDCNEISNAFCTKNECKCKAKHIAINKTSCKPFLGGSCTKNDDCGTHNSICIDNQCQCSHNYTAMSNFHCMLSLLGGHCRDDADCMSMKNAMCSGGICVCNKDNYAVNRKDCAPVVGGHCSEDNQCFSDNMICIDNECQCDVGFESVSLIQCALAETLFGCNVNAECSDIWHAKCSNKNKCVCRENNVAYGTSCLPLLSGYCWRDDQCRAHNSVCVDFRCQCRTFSVAVANNSCVLEI